MLLLTLTSKQENLTPESTIQLLENLRKGLPVKVGPQNHQKDCEGPLGRTTLNNPESITSVCRDFDALKKQAEEKAKAEAAAKAAAKAAAASGTGPAPPKA